MQLRRYAKYGDLEKLVLSGSYVQGRVEEAEHF